MYISANQYLSGAGGSIGRAIAIRLAKEGATVMIADIDESKAKETADLIMKAGEKAQFTQLDVTNEDQVKAWMTKQSLLKFNNQRV